MIKAKNSLQDIFANPVSPAVPWKKGPYMVRPAMQEENR
jgi:hypothetical protein